jgi:hypothetical protein
MLDRPPNGLEEVELCGRDALVLAVGEGFPAGVAEVVAAGAGHVRAALDLLDHLSAPFALPEFGSSLKLHGDAHPALPSMLQLVAIRAMLLPAELALPPFLRLINHSGAFFPLAGEVVGVLDDEEVADYFAITLSLVFIQQPVTFAVWG